MNRGEATIRVVIAVAILYIAGYAISITPDLGVSLAIGAIAVANTILEVVNIRRGVYGK